MMSRIGRKHWESLLQLLYGDYSEVMKAKARIQCVPVDLALAHYAVISIASPSPM